MHNQPKIALFCYDFPHRKTYDFVTRLWFENIAPTLFIAAPKVALKVPKSSVRSTVVHQCSVHPNELAQRLGAKYAVLKHADFDAIGSLVSKYNIDLAIISGARILPSNIIDLFPKGVINFHPGLIPQARGLDAIWWSVLDDVPLGVTAHLIDEKVDFGRLLQMNEIEIDKGDSIMDLSERVYEAQLEMIRPAVELAISERFVAISANGRCRSIMPDTLKSEVIKKLEVYKSTILCRHFAEEES